MKKEEIKKHIDAIIENTFDVLVAIKNGDNRKSRLIFPSYRNEGTRYSEQELRFAFLEQFASYCQKNKLPWLYSVETPTEKQYQITGEGKRSAEVDLTIHDENRNRLALIEFKANQVSKSHFDKDFMKLHEEPGDSLRYFVMYVLAKQPKRSLNALNTKMADKKPDTIFVCYDLQNGSYLIDER